MRQHAKLSRIHIRCHPAALFTVDAKGGSDSMAQQPHALRSSLALSMFDCGSFNCLFWCLFIGQHRAIRLGSVHTQHPDPCERPGQPVAVRLGQKTSNSGDECRTGHGRSVMLKSKASLLRFHLEAAGEPSVPSSAHHTNNKVSKHKEPASPGLKGRNWLINLCRALVGQYCADTAGEHDQLHVSQGCLMH